VRSEGVAGGEGWGGPLSGDVRHGRLTSRQAARLSEDLHAEARPAGLSRQIAGGRAFHPSFGGGLSPRARAGAAVPGRLEPRRRLGHIRGSSLTWGRPRWAHAGRFFRVAHTGARLQTSALA